MTVEKFIQQSPSTVLELIKFFSKRSLELTVVGGIPRDYLLTGIVGKDWDIEVSSSTLGFSLSFWKDLAKDLKVFGEVSNLSYHVIRLKVGEYEYEFSPPRIENFNDSDHHKNFEAEYDFGLLPQVCWKRRDFTINAIGFKLKQDGVEVVDPFGGQEMLFGKYLHPCSEQFVRDPVRYLRAYRFSLRLGFSFSETLATYLQKMPQSFSSHYLYSEMKKSKAPLDFYLSLIKGGCQNLPVIDSRLENDSFKKSLVDENNLYSWILALEFEGVNAEEFCQYFGLSKPLQKKLSSFAHHSKELNHIDLEFLKQDFKIVQDSSQLQLVFSWYFSAMQLFSKNETIFVREFVRLALPEWSYLFSFEPLKDVRHIEPVLRSKYIVWNLCQRI